MDTATKSRFALILATEKGQRVDRTLFLILGRANVRGIGMTPSYKVTDHPEFNRVTTWANRETAEKWAAHHSRYPELKTIEVVEIDPATFTVL